MNTNPTYKIHPSADVHTKQIGEGTAIWQFAVILEGAEIGANCNINCHTFIENRVKLGDRVTIKSGVYLWDGISLEDDVFVGPCAVFTNDLRPRSKNYGNVVNTLIKKGASIGANSSILAGTTVGRFALIGMGANIVKDVPDHALVYGNPAIIKGWVDEKGKHLIKKSDEIWVSESNETYIKSEIGIGLKKVA